MKIHVGLRYVFRFGEKVSGVSVLADTGYKSRPSFDKIAMAIWCQVSGIARPET